MKKILSISNSFGEDATRYLYGLCRGAGVRAKIVTLYIGGCSLSQHYRYWLGDKKNYAYIFNGMKTGLTVTLKEALLSDEWDAVVLQQCSPDSGNWDSYLPFLPFLAEQVRKYSPKAELHLQATWSFAEGCPRFELTAFRSREEMIPAVRGCYEKGAELIGADGIVPSLDAMNLLYDAVGDRAYRDGFHASLGLGRYTLACVWFRHFFGGNPEESTFRDFDVPLSDEEIDLAHALSEKAVK